MSAIQASPTRTLNLRLTGPTPLSPEVAKATSGQMVSHRGKAFRALMTETVGLLQPVFGTTQQPMLFTTSGTGGLEAAIVNTLAPGDKVVAIKIGMFGDRFAEIAIQYGMQVVPIDVAWGQAVSVETVEEVLRAHPDTKAVLITHNETSTGVTNPLQRLAQAIRAQSEALILVDGVSSVGGMAIDMDANGLDVVVTASQKALMAPPGLAVIAASERAMAQANKHLIPRYYFDFPKMAEAVSQGTTTYTPAIPSIYGLNAALKQIHDEGLTAVYERHRRLAQRCREELVALGLTLFAEPSVASATVTAVLLADESASSFRARLESEHGVFLSQGRSHWKNRMVRIGHMGLVNEDDITHLIFAMTQVQSS